MSASVCVGGCVCKCVCVCRGLCVSGTVCAVTVCASVCVCATTVSTSVYVGSVCEYASQAGSTISVTNAACIHTHSPTHTDMVSRMMSLEHIHSCSALCAVG